jgi:hypothetical protein
MPARNRRLRALLLATAFAAATWPQVGSADRARQPKAETEGRGPSASESLSERLDRSGGVIRPPQTIDPGIHAPAPEPNPGTTPVIPPPGTPGGDQGIQPK